MNDLSGRFISRDHSDRGTQAIIALVEPNDEVHIVRCLALPSNMTEIYGPVDELMYLNERYGEDTVAFVSRMTTMSGPER